MGGNSRGAKWRHMAPVFTRRPYLLPCRYEDARHTPLSAVLPGETYRTPGDRGVLPRDSCQRSAGRRGAPRRGGPARLSARAACPATGACRHRRTERVYRARVGWRTGSGSAPNRGDRWGASPAAGAARRSRVCGRGRWSQRAQFTDGRARAQYPSRSRQYAKLGAERAVVAR